ncbi:hypothetical protein AX16_001503 [Volvariella volvacea WC 439]|nr:hypothetical protein AX16_001503 [Volvariella volvacea WC 439]
MDFTRNGAVSFFQDAFDFNAEDIKVNIIHGDLTVKKGTTRQDNSTGKEKRRGRKAGQTASDK